MAMRFHNVAIAAVGYSLPTTCVTSQMIEQQLEPLYTRLKLPTGRLELMTGIEQRRFWPAGQLPSTQSIRSGELALAAADVDPHDIGCLVHGSVCRDYLEPATACRVHDRLGLPEHCLIYDVSNACLGLLDGMVQIACMIELGQIEAGLVVGCESGRSLVESTMRKLLGDTTLTRRQIKSAIASLTIGSASAAVLLRRADGGMPGSPLVLARSLARTTYHDLCQSDRDDAVGDGMQPLMDTDSERLMHEGVAAAAACFHGLTTKLPQGMRLTKTVCHQVGTAQRKQLLDRLQLNADADFITYPWLGNTGSVALPVSLAVAVQSGHFVAGDGLGLLGIGSGINVLMLGVQFDQMVVAGEGRLGPLDGDAGEPLSVD